MTYNLGLRPLKRPTNMHELTLSAAQTLSSGDVIKFDTLRSTSAGGVSNNASTGEITLDTSKRYTFIASLDVDRASNTDSIRVAFFDGSTELTHATGGYDATWEHHTGGTTGQPNCTLQAWYSPAGAPVSPITLKIFDIGNNSAINTNFSLLIIEVDV